MLRLQRAVGACLMVSVLLPTVAVQAATYYVATTGNNSNPGTKDRPWRTVAHAVNTMVAGDTTLVRGGTYSTEGTIRFNKSGTSGAPIKLLNYPGESPKIDWVDQSGKSILIQHASGVNVAMAFITIEGFELTRGHDGIKFYSAQDLTIRRNWIHDNLNQGILGVGGLRVLIERNIINHNGNFPECAAIRARCNQIHGIYGHGALYRITNNLIYDNQASGIQQNGSSTSTYSATRHPSTEFAGAADWVIAHNTFAYQANAPAVIVWGALCHNARLENNIFYENRVAGTNSQSNAIYFTSLSCTGIQIRNNHAYASGSGGLPLLGGTATEGTHYTQSGNIVNVSNPGFVNAPATLPATPNFALTARSPVIDAGVPLAETRIDFIGTTRPQGRAPDIGAYEYTAVGDAQSPAAPKTLKAH